MFELGEVKFKSGLLRSATVRDFSGGYNILDSDINLASKYAKAFFNVYNIGNNKVKVRYGTSLFANARACCTVPGTQYVVNMAYFSSALLAFMSNGEIIRIYADGSMARIWDSVIAAALPGAPAGWSACTFVSFQQFNGKLIVCNGIDKPLIINNSLSVSYLQDLATGSNLNVPRCRYVTAVNRFLVMAGDPVYPNRVHISSRDTSGTWFGDPPPNDGTYVDVGSLLNNASTIKGIHGFRGQLIVAFEEGIVVGTLGNYDNAGNHEPDFQETIQEYGAISHRTIIDFGDDMLMMDGIGVPSFKKTVFSGTIRPERVSDLVDPEMADKITGLSTATLEDRTFSVYDRNEGVFMFFIPNNDVLANTTETTAYIYSYRPNLGANSWARFDGMNWTCAARSLQGNVFFGDVDGKVWLYGSTNNPYYKDKLNDLSVNNGEGIAIDFEWELPWSDMNRRSKIKKTKYILIETEGDATFQVDMYVDRIRLNNDLVDTPLLSMEFTGGDSLGYGGAYNNFGGGRVTSDENLYKWPAKFKLMKLRISGQAESELVFSGITLFYQEGGVFR